MADSMSGVSSNAWLEWRPRKARGQTPTSRRHTYCQSLWASALNTVSHSVQVIAPACSQWFTITDAGMSGRWVLAFGVEASLSVYPSAPGPNSSPFRVAGHPVLLSPAGRALASGIFSPFFIGGLFCAWAEKPDSDPTAQQLRRAHPGGPGTLAMSEASTLPWLVSIPSSHNSLSTWSSHLLSMHQYFASSRKALERRGGPPELEGSFSYSATCSYFHGQERPSM
ncbi:hypothetical protein QBC39DRAFT_18110 [Podospora conica]|nr:hypothetical protein QBC39DRAFT_18110 [Schizothecium conicum]